MEMEADFLLYKLQIDNIEKIGKYTFYEGSILDYPVVLCLCKVNTRNASVATYIAIDKYHPIDIINPLTAGGHGKLVHPGDIIIVKDCFNIISGRAPIKSEGEGSNSLERDMISFNGDSGHIFEMLSGSGELIKIAETIDNPYGQLYTGVLASGDFWNREYDKIMFLNSNYNSLGEDMECIAVYNIAQDFNVPVLGIKAISNNEIIGEKLDKNMAKIGQEFTYNFILKLIENAKK